MHIFWSVLVGFGRFRWVSVGITCRDVARIFILGGLKPQAPSPSPPFPLPSLPPPLPSLPLPLEVGPLIAARGPGGAL